MSKRSCTNTSKWHICCIFSWRRTRQRPFKQKQQQSKQTRIISTRKHREYLLKQPKLSSSSLLRRPLHRIPQELMLHWILQPQSSLKTNAMLCLDRASRRIPVVQTGGFSADNQHAMLKVLTCHLNSKSTISGLHAAIVYNVPSTTVGLKTSQIQKPWWKISGCWQ